MEKFKQIGIIIIGWAFLVLGVLGLFLPVLQGILFIMIGLAILSSRSDMIKQCMEEAGLGRIHSLEYSLGTWGKTDRLPDFQILETVTMCGHAMISADLVRKMLRDVKRGRRTVEDACLELAKCCTCGNSSSLVGSSCSRICFPNIWSIVCTNPPHSPFTKGGMHSRSLFTKGDREGFLNIGRRN